MNDRGASAVEYALLCAGVAALMIGPMTALGKVVNEHNRCVAATMGQIAPPLRPGECPGWGVYRPGPSPAP